jgi:hypothetical protein
VDHLVASLEIGRSEELEQRHIRLRLGSFLAAGSGRYSAAVS